MLSQCGYRCDVRSHLTSMFHAAVAALDPTSLVEAVLVRRGLDRRVQPVTVLALGKAAAGMVWGAHRVFGGAMTGVAALASESELPEGVAGIVGSHPVPDEASVAAGEALLAAAAAADPDSLVVCLVSGGGSALAEVPAAGVTIGDLAAVNRLLLDSGAPVAEFNSVRRSLSQLKGGGLAARIASPQIITLAISDVGDAAAEMIASGPTIAPRSGPEPLEVLQRYGLLEQLPRGVAEAVRRSEVAEAIDHPIEVIADGTLAATAAADEGRRRGLSVEIAKRALAGEAAVEVRRVLDDACHREVDVVVHAGETTVTVNGSGRGGRNHEAALAAAIEIADTPAVFLAAGTDGIDGLTDGAGAVVDGETVHEAKARGLEPVEFLADNDSGAFFDVVPGRVVTGPTGTNVADIWLVADNAT